MSIYEFNSNEPSPMSTVICNRSENDNEPNHSKISFKKYVDYCSQSSSSECEEEEYSASGQSIAITPFNMKEELKEGYFDSDGTYHWKNNSSNDDKWLETINWNSSPKCSVQEAVPLDSSDYESDEAINEIYKKILNYMKPKETVEKAICRLGKNSLTTTERWKLKKLGRIASSNYEIKNVTDLTELANNILNKVGNVDIYQETYETLVEKINKTFPTPQSLLGKRKLSALDMFSDNFEEQEKKLLK